MKTAEEWAKDLGVRFFDDIEPQRICVDADLGFETWIKNIQSDARKELEQQIDAQSNLICNIQDTCRSRGFMQRPVDEAVIALAQERDTLQRELNEVKAIQAFALDKDYYEKFDRLRASHEVLQRSNAALSVKLAAASLVMQGSPDAQCKIQAERIAELAEARAAGLLRITALEQAEAGLSAQVASLRGVLGGWMRYFQDDIPKTSEGMEAQGEEFSSLWFSSEELLRATALTPSDALKEYMKPWVEFVEWASRQTCESHPVQAAVEWCSTCKRIDQARQLLAAIGK